MYADDLSNKNDNIYQMKLIQMNDKRERPDAFYKSVDNLGLINKIALSGHQSLSKRF